MTLSKPPQTLNIDVIYLSFTPKHSTIVWYVWSSERKIKVQVSLCIYLEVTSNIPRMCIIFSAGPTEQGAAHQSTGATSCVNTNSRKLPPSIASLMEQHRGCANHHHFTTRLCKNVVVSKQVKTTVAIFDQQKESVTSNKNNWTTYTANKEKD